MGLFGGFNFSHKEFVEPTTLRAEGTTAGHTSVGTEHVFKKIIGAHSVVLKKYIIKSNTVVMLQPNCRVQL